MTTASVHIQRLLADNNGIISSRQAKSISRGAYYHVLQLVDEGKLHRLKNGLFIDSSRLANTMIDIKRLIPSGILCLFSAWYHYGLTTQIPTEFNVAIDKDRRIRIPEYPPVHLLHWSGATLTLGVTSARISGYEIPIYDIEKSVCDAVKFRNKVGIDIMAEVLRNYFQRPDRNIMRLENYGRQLKIYSTLQKYMEIAL